MQDYTHARLKCDYIIYKKVLAGNDQEKAQSEINSHSKTNEVGKSKLTIKYLYLENISYAV